MIGARRRVIVHARRVFVHTTLRGTMLGLIAVSAAFPVGADDPIVTAAAHLQAGHDSEVLVDPERDGIVAPVAAPVLALGSQATLDWPGILRPAGRLVLGATTEFAGYGRDGPRRDVALSADARYYQSLGARGLLHGGTSFYRFRRADLPLFDLDRFGLEAGGSWRTGTSWLVRLGAAHSWPHYDGRLISGSATRTERDRHLELLGSLLWQPDVAHTLELGIGGRRSDSNDSLVTYQGPRLLLRGVIAGIGLASVSGYLTYDRRNYEAYPVLEAQSGELVDTGGERTDHLWQLGGTVEWPVARRLALFVQGAFVWQDSNIDDLDFTRRRLTSGVRMTWGGAPGEGRGSALAAPPRLTEILPEAALRPDTDPLAPQVLAEGVLFRFRAPGARTVAVVG